MSHTAAHPPLDSTEGHIRLLSFEDPEDSTGVFKLVSRVYALDDKPVYTALSYPWGEIQDTHTVQLNGSELRIGLNLYQALGSLRHQVLHRKDPLETESEPVTDSEPEADSELETDSEPETHSDHDPDDAVNPDWRLLWIDALSINQQDLEERKDQVGIMGLIYHAAEQVAVWLGPDCKAAFEFCHEWDWDDSDIHASLSEYQPPLSHIYESTYWERAWILQEFLRARSITFISGEEDIAYSTFRDATIWLAGHDREWSDVDTRFTVRCLIAERIDGPQLHSFDRIADLLDFTGYTKCTDSRDKIYSLLGLVDWSSTPWLEPLPADYTIDGLELYRRLLRLNRAHKLGRGRPADHQPHHFIEPDWWWLDDIVNAYEMYEWLPQRTIDDEADLLKAEFASREQASQKDTL